MRLGCLKMFQGVIAEVYVAIVAIAAWKKNCDVDVKLFDVPDNISIINFVVGKFGYIAKWNLTDCFIPYHLLQIYNLIW